MNELDALRKRLRAFPVALDGDIIMLLDALDARTAALRELVACKNIAELIDARSDDYHRAPATDALQAEYDKRKPLAWAAARKVLGDVPAEGR
jgi:hypothetical protein